MNLVAGNYKDMILAGVYWSVGLSLKSVGLASLSASYTVEDRRGQEDAFLGVEYVLS